MTSEAEGETVPSYLLAVSPQTDDETATDAHDKGDSDIDSARAVAEVLPPLEAVELRRIPVGVVEASSDVVTQGRRVQARELLVLDTEFGVRPCTTADGFRDESDIGRCREF